MDDHVYEYIMDYARIDLIPRFQTEYKNIGKMSECPSYQEMKDLCVCLNAICKYAGYSRVVVKDFIDEVM